ncbi:hypothetical protein LTR37_016985 [Vermiconidia calcicola]|uniref:Uncharacterized protein n=1 Tax=Vermiconidia calcicola TaxID=1690605 RepID=A0ACC3MMY1_9PEZI|nr:hypothetical protein LTR37_016985 [Vermiconidia calcicola]
MLLKYLIAAAAAADLVVSQRVEGQVGAANETTPTARECDSNGCRTIHYVDVGKANHNFYPNSINAREGDIVSFQFYPANHSVIRAAYGYPCVPYEYLEYGEEGFYSGFFPILGVQDSPPVWNLTINSTEPIFYYCGAPDSCTGYGMLGAINANGSTPVSSQITLARQADYMLIPGEPFPTEEELLSMSKLAQVATTVATTITASPTRGSAAQSSNAGGGSPGNNDHQSSLSTGAIAGIAVAAGVVGIGGAALFFLLARTRSLKKRLDQQQQQQQPTTQPPGPGQAPFAGNDTSMYDSSGHMSVLPPYQGYGPHGQEVIKTHNGEYISVDRTGSPQLSPPMHPQQFPQYPPMNPRFTTYTTTSELGGNEASVVELAAPASEAAKSAEMTERSNRY